MCVALAQRNDYLTGRLPQQQADSSLSAQHSDDKDGESDEDAETTFDMSTVDIEAQFKELKALERKQQAERKRKLLSLSADSPKGKDDMGGSSSGAARGASGGAATQRAIANRGSNKKPRHESDGGPNKAKDARLAGLASASGVAAGSPVPSGSSASSRPGSVAPMAGQGSTSSMHSIGIGLHQGDDRVLQLASPSGKGKKSISQTVDPDASVDNRRAVVNRTLPH